MSVLKRLLLTLMLLIVSILLVYVSYEWLCEWFGESSKFNFALDGYSFIGVSSILFLLLVIVLIFRKIRVQ